MALTPAERCKRYYEKLENKEGYKRRAEAIKDRNRSIIHEAKSVPCMDCGLTYPYYVMDFDHVRGEKVGNISCMIASGEQKLLDEIAKCDVVCSNCHRIRTFARLV